MKSWLNLFVKNRLLTVLVLVFMIVAGSYSLLHMPVDLFPNLEIPVVNIITHDAGVSPEDMELLISRPIENEMRSIPGIKRVSSTSVQGISRVAAEFSWGTTVRDARQLVQAHLSRISQTLPVAARPHLENIGTTLQEVSGYIIYGGGDTVTLRNTAEHDLVSRLMGVEGVSSVDVLGGDKRAFYVRLKQDRLKSINMTAGDIVALLRRNNVSQVSGYLDKYSREYLIRGDARVMSVQDLKNMAVCNVMGSPVLLGNIADIYEGHAPKHYAVYGDNRPAVAVLIRKQPGSNTIDVANRVDRAIQELKSLFPVGVTIKKFYDQSEIIEESRDEIMFDLAIGALLAVMVLYFFLGSFRPTLIVALTIPVSVLATIAVMRYLGESLNIITMTAIALGIGMIVDDAIVVAENIFRKRMIESDPVKASIYGALEIAGPDASGTFTTVAVFCPLLLLSGIAAIFMRPFGITISTALLVSLFLSLTLIPSFFSAIKNLNSGAGKNMGAKCINFLSGRLERILRYCFAHRIIVFICTVCFLGLAGLSGLLGKFDILPPLDEGAILLEYVMPPGTSLKESNRIGKIIERAALQNPSVFCVYRRTGSPRIGYQVESVNKGELLIKLKSKNVRKKSIGQVIESFKSTYSKIKGVVFLYHQPTQEKIDESFSGLPALFGVTVYGDDYKKLISIASEVENIMSKNPGISNIVNNTKVNIQQLVVKVNYPAAAQYGVDPANILSTLQSINIGTEATTVVRQKEVIPIIVKSNRDSRLDISEIKDIPVVTRSGSWIPLSRLADITVENAPASITRLNGTREITLICEAEGNLFEVIDSLRSKFKAINLPHGYNVDFTGQYNVLISTAIEMIFAVVAAILLIYLIIAMQFASWYQPLVILITVPLSLVGAVIGLFVTGHGLDISVGMGAVTLVGVAVNNAILLIDFANREVRKGAIMTDALITASKVRLRPILLSSLTTIAALIPAAIGTTVGSVVFQPFAVTVIVGLLTGFAATLIVVPTILSAKRK